MPVDAPEDLYGLPLDRFIPERTALVKALRAEKRREEAGEVAALRKPSVAAWAINQLVRTQPTAIRALFEAGDALANAQRDAAEGRHSGEAMREATRRQRQAVAELTEAAEGLLSSEGDALSPSTLEHVADTLRAAAIDEDARRQVKSGCLTRELRFAGLGLAGLGLAGPGAVSTSASAPRRSTQEATEAQTAAKADADRRRAALTAARQAETQARRAATRADKELAAARSRRDQAAAAADHARELLAKADDALAAAQQSAERTAADLTAAEQAVKDLGDA